MESTSNTAMDLDQSSPSAVQTSVETGRVVIEEVVACVNQHLDTLMKEMVSKANDRLFDEAEKAESEAERMKYMDCTHIFRTQKNDIEYHFSINLQRALSPQVAELSIEDDGLSLVDQNEMEEMVAITTMHSKAMNLFGESVNHVETRLEYLEIALEDMFDKESLDPRHICEVFQETIKSIDADIEVKLIFYKLFDQEVCSKLAPMYDAINRICIDHGILPEIVLKTTNKEEVDEPEEVSSCVASFYEPVDDIDDSIPRAKGNISRIVNGFMSGDTTISESEIELPESFLRKPTQRDIDGNNCYQRRDVLKALSSLQRKIKGLDLGAELLTSEQIKQEMLSGISEEHGGVIDKQVNLLHERCLDFVGMMFNAIAKDATVSEIMTSLIYQLQVPVMKLAMIDTDVFENEKHPARTTVDLLTVAGKGINGKDDTLYENLVRIVDDILDNFDIDVASFQRATEELEGLLGQEEDETRETERQQQRKVMQQVAKDIVVTEIKAATAGKSIPDTCKPLVLKHLPTLMGSRYLKHGRDSMPWMQSVMLLKLLLSCMQPIKKQAQYELVKNNHLALVDAVNDELYETRQDKEEIAEQILALKQHFIKLLDDYGLTLVDEDGQEMTPEEILQETGENTGEELERIRKQTDIAKQKIAQLTSSTRPGVWYEIYNGEDKPVRRLKLSVILTDIAQLVFVDRKGIKVIEKDAEEFARELEEDRSRMIADHSTFDMALGNVIKAMAA